jgi:hypothetical protein
MKKVIVFMLLLSGFSATLFGQNLLDYFCVADGASAEYETTIIENGKKTTDRVFVSVLENEQDKITVSYTTDMSGIAKAEVYEVYPDRVILVSSRTLLGNQTHNEIIMRQLGQEWTVQTRTSGEYYTYTAAPADLNSIQFIGVLKKYYVQGQLKFEEFNYYARGVGLSITMTMQNDKLIMSRVLVDYKNP